MARLGIFRKKEKTETKRQVEKSLLEELCGSDSKLYNALTRTVLLNPQITIQGGGESYVAKAQEYVKNNDRALARIAYHAAGEISLYEGKLAQAQKFFKQAAETDPGSIYQSAFEFYANKENAEKALKVAREFYARTVKQIEKKET